MDSNILNVPLRCSMGSWSLLSPGNILENISTHIYAMFNPYTIKICIKLKKNGFLFYRYSCSENRQAYRTMASKYDTDIIGQVMEGIVEFHKSQEVLYTLDEEAESVF